jgi:hypothetical protein
VTTADTLYLKSDAPVAVQLAMQNLLAGTGTTTSVVYVQGEVTMEFPAGGYLTGLAVQGVANVEWLASGPA